MVRFVRSLGTRTPGIVELSRGDRMNRHHITRLLRNSSLSVGTIVFLLKGILPTGVSAAETATPADKPSRALTAAAKSPDDDVLQEVVVTAEKRAEGLQNIPIAIT